MRAVHIIQKTCENALADKLLGDAGIFSGRSAIYEMAKEPRVSRRALASGMLQAAANFPDSKEPRVRNLTFMPSFYDDKGYIFLQVKLQGTKDYEKEYRPVRQPVQNFRRPVALN